MNMNMNMNMSMKMIMNMIMSLNVKKQHKNVLDSEIKYRNSLKYCKSLNCKMSNVICQRVIP